jgi:hypothetical protein
MQCEKCQLCKLCCAILILFNKSRLEPTAIDSYLSGEMSGRPAKTLLVGFLRIDDVVGNAQRRRWERKHI